MCARLPNDQKKIDYNGREYPMYHGDLKIKQSMKLNKKELKKNKEWGSKLDVSYVKVQVTLWVP